ncbi:hypothetical protein ACLB1G_06240 [Oxalobacteraceae bacterium A2-2]
MEILLLVAGVLVAGFIYSLLVAGTRPVVGSDYYSVSKDGRVMATRKGKVSCLRPRTTAEGLLVRLRAGTRTGEFPVHVLVAEAHLPNPGYERVRHKDGNIRNNHVHNLQWF